MLSTVYIYIATKMYIIYFKYRIYIYSYKNAARIFDWGGGGGIFRPTTTIMLREGLNQTPKFFTRKISFFSSCRANWCTLIVLQPKVLPQSPGDLSDFW